MRHQCHCVLLFSRSSGPLLTRCDRTPAGLQCGLPANISSGSYQLQNGSRAYLSTVVYSCQPGHALVGRAELICDVDERWNGPPPRCQGG